MKTIYCVEDDAAIRDLITYALTTAGFEAVGFEAAAPFWEAMTQRRPALVLLDIMLPGEDGLAILRRLRQSGDAASIPVILLTAKSAEYDKVTGLDLGADDYVTKPFGVMELLSRVKALLRRAGSPAPTSGEALAVGSIELNRSRHVVTVEGQEVSLTNKEFELLAFLLENPGIVHTRDRLLDAVWGYVYEGESRTVDVHIASLRQKLGNSSEVVETVRGVGYRLEVRP